MGRRGVSGGDDASSSHRRGSRRSHRSDRCNGMDDSGDRHRHRHRDGNDDRDSDSLDDHQHRHRRHHRSSHHRRRGSTERGGGDNECMQPERGTRLHRCLRRERDDGGNEYDSFDNDRLSRRCREHSEGDDDAGDRHGRCTKGKRYRDPAATERDDGHQRGRKYRFDSRQGVDGAGRSTSSNPVADASDCRAHGDRLQMDNRVAGQSYTANSTVDWSSRRGRQRIPSFAYDLDQQKRFLGFLDRRDASRGRVGAAAMEFTIGADGLVQMPPPPTLVRRQNRHRISVTSNDDRNGSSSWQRQQRRKRSPPGCAASTADSDGEHGDDKSSVASHESLYHDPATVQVGILPDIVPPSNLYRVALFGVDISLTASHISSIVGQLLGGGVKPWRVRRPAREILHAAASCSHAAEPHQQPLSTPLASHTSTITCAPSVSRAVLAEERAGASSWPGMIGGPSASVSETLHTTATSTIGVLSGKSFVAGHGGGGVLPDAASSSAASGVLGYGDEKASGIAQGNAGGQQVHMREEEIKGILPYPSSLPPPPQPAPPAFYLPGLHDANGPGGMVVLEFTEQTHACRSMQLLNGAYVNGRRVAASM
ncbi:hypothetical protein CUR178_00862 [Leishmania enriettii]|uniref:Uncharacterized protein n=1 Tax=Leishmania enriettii TaxID=5663 RepID=A0A836G3G6_LEIEN|nr:hypothetical protein CUR178_00862 [Leishmania enriettii]